MLPSRGFRKLVVDGHTYLWKARASKSDGNEVTIAASREGGQILKFYTVFPDREILPWNSVVTPAAIEFLIRTARKQGWRGDGKGIFTIERNPEFIDALLKMLDPTKN